MASVKPFAASLLSARVVDDGRLRPSSPRMPPAFAQKPLYAYVAV